MTCVRMENGNSFVKRRRHSQHLTPLVIPTIPIPMSLPVGVEVDDSVKEGEVLFRNFVQEELDIRRLESPPVVANCTSRGSDNPEWRKAGRELRWMADAFAQTPDREKIRKRASQVGIGEVDCNQFVAMLSELFNEGGVTKERIMVLFFFCADVALRSLASGENIFEQIMQWSLNFIAERVCSWVRNHGGWSAIFAGTGIPAVKYATVAAALVVVFYIGWQRYRSH